MTTDKHSSGTVCGCHFICTYDHAEKEIAWYNEVDGRLKFLGHGSTAPMGYRGFHDSEVPDDVAEALSA